MRNATPGPDFSITIDRIRLIIEGFMTNVEVRGKGGGRNPEQRTPEEKPARGTRSVQGIQSGGATQVAAAALPGDSSRKAVEDERKRQGDLARTVEDIRKVFDSGIYGKASLAGVKKDGKMSRLVDLLYSIARPEEYLKRFGKPGQAAQSLPALEELKSLLEQAKELAGKIVQELKKVPQAIGNVYTTRPTAYAPINTPMEGGPRGRKGVWLPDHTLQEYLRRYDKAREAGREYDFLRNDKQYMAIAMDHRLQDRKGSPLPYGSYVRIPELEKIVNSQRAAKGLPPIPYIRCRIVDCGGAFTGKGTGRVDLCMDKGNMQGFKHNMARWSLFRVA